MIRAKVEKMLKTEDGCKQLLFLGTFRKGKFKCRKCKFKAYVWCTDKKPTIKCAKCGEQKCLTKGTFFERLRTPMTKVLGILYGYTQSDDISAAALARQFEVAYSTVWRLLHRLRKLFDEIYQHSSRRMTVRSSDLQVVLFKRSLESKALSAKGPKPKPISTVPPDKASKAVVATSTIDITRRYQGIARKYAQLYAAEQFFRRSGDSFLALLRKCLGFRPVSTEEIEKYSSPDLIVLAA